MDEQILAAIQAQTQAIEALAEVAKAAVAVGLAIALMACVRTMLAVAELVDK